MAAAAMLNFEIVKFYWLTESRVPRHINVANFVKIGQSIVKISQFIDFLKSRPLLSWIFEFAKFYWLKKTGSSRRITVQNCVKIDNFNEDTF